MNTAVNQFNYRFKLTDYAMFDRNRQRRVSIYGRVSTEHEAQLSALENQMQWYDDQAKYHPNWMVVEKYIDEGITGTQAKKRPAFLRMLEDARSGKFDLIATREVCRFARNVVDTLVVTRELKNIGVEVFFIEDNIWTMDGDGELRLSLMATLAQEESRKTSERVKAGQKISRDNGVLYGSGNILGYDRVGSTYVINEEQAETVRMIYDLYLQGYGSMKIANILTERKRKTASGLVKWSISNIMRAIRNATYTGTKCYNKSRSNNFLEQKRINNLDMSTYEYVEGDFPAIISKEVWDKAQEIRMSRVKPSLVSSTKTTHSKRDSKDIWVNLLRCSCGSSFRKNKWHTKNDGGISYGYQCYNQLNNGNKKKREELGLDTEGFCDSRMIADWKLDFMAKSLLEHLWTDRKESVLLALDLIKRYYKDERVASGKGDTTVIQAKLNKATSRLQNLIAMRADGEITKDEYQAMRSPIDAEIRDLQRALEEVPQTEEHGNGLDLDGITATLHSLVDFSEPTLNHDVINKFVYQVTPTSDTSFHWYINLNGNTKARAIYTVEGRKKKNVIKLEEIEEISSLHRKENEDATVLIQNPLVFALLHRLRLKRAERFIQVEFDNHKAFSQQIKYQKTLQEKSCKVFLPFYHSHCTPACNVKSGRINGPIFAAIILPDLHPLDGSLCATASSVKNHAYDSYKGCCKSDGCVSTRVAGWGRGGLFHVRGCCGLLCACGRRRCLYVRHRSGRIVRDGCLICCISRILRNNTIPCGIGNTQEFIPLCKLLRSIDQGLFAGVIELQIHISRK